MLPASEIERLKTKVEQYFGDEDERLADSAARLQHDGYSDTDIINILRGPWRAGYEQGYDEGYEYGIG